MNASLTSDNMNIFIMRYIIGTFITTLLGYGLTITKTIDASQVVYIGPFLVVIITCEHMFNHYNIPAKSWLSQIKFWLLVCVSQMITLVIILYAKGSPANGLAYLFIAQTIFTIFGVFVASLYQNVRSKKN